MLKPTDNPTKNIENLKFRMLAQGLKAVCAGVATVAGLKTAEKRLSKSFLKAKDDYKWDFNWDKRHPQEDWTDDEKLKFT